MSQHAIDRSALRTDSLPVASPSDALDQDYRRLWDLLDDRLRFESFLARLSATFINLPAEDVDSQIDRSLQQLVEFLQIERCCLAQFSEDGRQLLVTHSYTVPGFAAMMHVDMAALWPWYTARVRAGHVFRLNRLPEDLPAEAVQEREYVLREGAPRSSLAIPFKVGDVVLGGLGVGSFRREIDWSPHVVQSLQLVGQIFANALARRRADLALRESERRFRLLADAAPVMVWMSGPDKQCTYFNKPWLDFTGRSLHQELGNGWSDGVHGDDSQRCLATYCQAFDARQQFRMEYRLRRADGAYHWILDTGIPRFEADGTFEGYIGSCIDITEERRAEEALRQVREQLAHAGRVTLMGELAASIAHEVNQPLCAIVTNAQAIQRLLGAEGEGGGVAEVREALRDIVDDGQRASAVLARIRGFVQKAPVQTAPLEVNELIQEVAALMLSEMTRRSVTMTLELADALPAVLGDRIQLQQVLVNLIVNAADAMARVARDKRTMVLRSTLDSSAAVSVAVEDAGEGLDRTIADQAFEAFVTTKPGSMGMGLAICKSIVEAHGGRITAAANAGRGTTFQFTLPAAEGRLT
jgi:PAS domain S-box-containing protein